MYLCFEVGRLYVCMYVFFYVCMFGVYVSMYVFVREYACIFIYTIL